MRFAVSGRPEICVPWWKQHLGIYISQKVKSLWKMWNYVQSKLSLYHYITGSTISVIYLQACESISLTNCIHLYLPIITEHSDPTNDHHQLTQTEVKDWLLLFIAPLITLDHSSTVIHCREQVTLTTSNFSNKQRIFIIWIVLYSSFLQISEYRETSEALE